MGTFYILHEPSYVEEDSDAMKKFYCNARIGIDLVCVHGLQSYDHLTYNSIEICHDISAFYNNTEIYTNYRYGFMLDCDLHVYIMEYFVAFNALPSIIIIFVIGIFFGPGVFSARTCT